VIQVIGNTIQVLRNMIQVIRLMIYVFGIARQVVRNGLSPLSETFLMT
jgi:hypothetical protein